MIDVLAGAVKTAEADTTLMGYFAASTQKIYMGQSPQPQTAYPRAVVIHVRTTWKKAKSMDTSPALERYDTTIFQFIVHSDDLPTLNRIQLRLQAIFDTGRPFALVSDTGATVASTTAAMASCAEEPGGDIKSLPQPNQQQLSIHRLDIRFKCEVTRHQ